MRNCLGFSTEFANKTLTGSNMLKISKNVHEYCLIMSKNFALTAEKIFVCNFG
jgi:hypothetical protein